jgi:predicted acyl esterase
MAGTPRSRSRHALCVAALGALASLPWHAPGRIYEIDLNNLITSNTFLAGHRVRVQVFASFPPNFSRNLQNGKSEATSADARKATITIHADARHASRIIPPAINP